jgi:hypothetical protein
MTGGSGDMSSRTSNSKNNNSVLHNQKSPTSIGGMQVTSQRKKTFGNNERSKDMQRPSAVINSNMGLYDNASNDSHIEL